jgi:hypothetical protein
MYEELAKEDEPFIVYVEPPRPPAVPLKDMYTTQEVPKKTPE